MNRPQYRQLHTAGREFHTLFRLATEQADRGDVDLMNHVVRRSHDSTSLAKCLRVWTNSRDTGSGYGAPISAMLRNPALKAELLPRYLSHFRMARYFRPACRLPR